MLFVEGRTTFVLMCEKIMETEGSIVELPLDDSWQ